MRRPAFPIVALALAILAPPFHASQAGGLYEVGLGGSHLNGMRGADLAGVHAAVDFAPSALAAVIARADFAAGDGETLQDFVLGARLGAVRGALRPYADIGVGFAPGSMSGAGLAVAAGLGVRLARPGPFGAFGFVRGLALGNLEEGDDLLEWRVGLTFEPRARAAEAGRAR